MEDIDKDEVARIRARMEDMTKVARIRAVSVILGLLNTEAYGATAGLWPPGELADVKLELARLKMYLISYAKNPGQWEFQPNLSGEPSKPADSKEQQRGQDQSFLTTYLAVLAMGAIAAVAGFAWAAWTI